MWGIQIDTPDNTYNTDGVDVDSSTDVTVRSSTLMEGDDCVALTTNNAAESGITVRDLNCYGTHGLSIGSGTLYGLSNILFADNTINGYDASGNASTDGNGIRVKSYPGNGGTVSEVEYLDTCMTGLQYPIVINPFYDPATGTGNIPWFQSITIDRALAVNSRTGAYSTIEGYSADYPTGLTLTDVNLDATAITAQYANVSLAHTNLDPAGTGVTDTTAPGNANPTPVHCTFPPFPGG